jgi:hypothetical protein
MARKVKKRNPLKNLVNIFIITFSILINTFCTAQDSKKSAQLFNKQLKPDNRAYYYGCNQDLYSQHLNTCIPQIESANTLENTLEA